MTTSIFISHGAGDPNASAGDTPDWFVVRASRRTMDGEVASLLSVRRTVYALDATPHEGRLIPLGPDFAQVAGTDDGVRITRQAGDVFELHTTSEGRKLGEIRGGQFIPLARTWLYGLTADEWLHLAGEGADSEVQPCCANLSEVRELLNTLATLQSPDDTGWQLSAGRCLLDVLESEGEDGNDYGHGLGDREAFPLLHRVLDGIRAQQAPFGLARNKEGTP